MKKYLILAAALCCFAAAHAQKNARRQTTPQVPATPTEVVTYGEGKNNWMNLYLPETDRPVPVYLWGHANARTAAEASANSIPAGLVKTLLGEKVAVVSWESVPQVTSYEEYLTCVEDLKKVYRWLKENAEKYNLDMDNLFIGGASRGTVVSWPFINRNSDLIRGAYLVQSVPVGAWNDRRTPLDDVNTRSPRVVMCYRDGVDTKDGHSPVYGLRVADKYKELGIGDRITIKMELGQENLYQFLPAFIRDNLK